MSVLWRMRRPACALLAATILLAGGAALLPPGNAAQPGAVTIDDFAFGPATITVGRGATVTWTNKDDEPHTVVSDADPKLFKSPALDTGDHFSFTFDRAGTFKYYCTIHPQMQGTIVVK